MPKLFPDTAQGAIDCLTEESTYDTAGAKAVHDPYAVGVWKVTLADKTTVIVYLMGHGNQSSATYNDFEEVDPD